MQGKDAAIIRLELKYCERCGGLWLREQGAGRVYCEGCTSETSGFPVHGRRLSRLYLGAGARPNGESREAAVRHLVCGKWERA